MDTAELVVRMHEMSHVAICCDSIACSQAATKEFESEVFADWCSPLVTCAREMMEIMAEVEPLLQ